MKIQEIIKRLNSIRVISHSKINGFCRNCADKVDEEIEEIKKLLEETIEK